MNVVTQMFRSFFRADTAEIAIKPMDGALAPNDKLDSLERVIIDGGDGPDDVAEDGEGGLLVSCGDKVLKLSAGGKVNEFVHCEGVVSALCSTSDGCFVVGIDGWGLIYFDRFGKELARCREASAPTCWSITALADDLNGGVFFAVGSRLRGASDWLKDLFERNVEGYVGHWDLRSNSLPSITVAKLAWPSGLLVEIDKGGRRKLIVTEGWTHDIWRYEVERNSVVGGQRLIRNMVGYPARISPAYGGGYWLALFARRTQLVELVLKEDAFRSAMMKSLAPELWIGPALRSTGDHREPLQMGGIRALGVRKAWAPPRSCGLVVRLSHDGEILESLQSRVGGHAHGVVAAREFGDRLVITSRGGRELLFQPLVEAK